MIRERDTSNQFEEVGNKLSEIFEVCGLNLDEAKDKSKQYLFEIASTAADKYLESVSDTAQVNLENELSLADTYSDIVLTLESHLGSDKTQKYLEEATAEVIEEMFTYLSPTISEDQYNQIKLLLEGDQNGN